MAASRSWGRLTVPFLLGLLVSCSGARPDPALPPGPADPSESVLLYARFADRVLEQGLLRSWDEATATGADTPGKIGLRPILDLTPDELDAFRLRLVDDKSIRLVRALTDTVFQIQSQSDTDVARLLTRIERVRATHLAGSEMGLGRLMTESSDFRAREAEWNRLRTPAEQLAPLLRELARSRNRWAHRTGDRPYRRMMVVRRGYDPSVMERMRAEVQAALAPDDLATLRKPWDPEGDSPETARELSKYLTQDKALPLAREALTWMAGATGEEALQLEVRHGGARYWPHATYAVSPPDDVRVLVSTGNGIFAYWSTFHEFGHAAHYLLAPSDGPRLLARPIAPAIAEGIAKIGERLVYTPEWLSHVGVPDELIARVVQWERASERWRMRGIVADHEFERILLSDPDADLGGAYRKVQREIAGVEVSPGFPAWALNRSLAFEPLERVDYLLARCAQAAIYRRLRSLPGGLLGEESRSVLRREVIQPSFRVGFEEWFERATGSAPSCDAWLEDVAGTGPAP